MQSVEPSFCPLSGYSLMQNYWGRWQKCRRYPLPLRVNFFQRPIIMNFTIHSHYPSNLRCKIGDWLPPGRQENPTPGGRCLGTGMDMRGRHFKSLKMDRRCQREKRHSDWVKRSFLSVNHFSPLNCQSTLSSMKSQPLLLCCYSLGHSLFITFYQLKPMDCSNSYQLLPLSLFSHYLNFHLIYFEHYQIVQNHCHIVIFEGPQTINWTRNIRTCQG